MTDLPSITRRTLIAAAGAAGAATLLTGAAATPARAVTRLTNLAHLDALTTTVRLPVTAAHTTYRLRREPNVGMLWVYADVQPDGSYRPVGGGDSYDAASDTWGQGAYRRRRRGPGGGRLPARMEGDRFGARPKAGLPAASRAGVLPDPDRRTCRRIRPVDAARRHPEPHPGTCRTTRTRRTRANPTGRLGRCGPTGRATRPSAGTTPPSPPSWPVGWTWQSRRSNATR